MFIFRSLSGVEKFDLGSFMMIVWLISGLYSWSVRNGSNK